MARLELTVLSLRYSSWSMRPWLALTHAGAEFVTETVALPHMMGQHGRSNGSKEPLRVEPTPLSDRRALGSVSGLFPVLRVDGVPIHESLAICEYVAEAFPDAGLWPESMLERARARAICSEMVSGLTAMRGELSSHLFARVPGFTPSSPVIADVARVFELWNDALARSGGPFLFGRFGIADAMYYPVCTRFRTYGVPVPDELAPYVAALDTAPAVQVLVEVAATAPRIAVYDHYVRRLGGDPDAGLAAAASFTG
jgi:glutathione S-transferase